MGKSARPLGLDVAAQKFNTTQEELQGLIDAGECSIGDVKGTIMCTYDTNTKLYTLQRKPKQSPAVIDPNKSADEQAPPANDKNAPESK